MVNLTIDDDLDLENLTIDDDFINKRVRLFIHQTMCREEKIIKLHNKVAKYLLDYFFKKIQKHPPEVQKQKFCKLHRKTSVLESFFNKVAGL